MQLQSTQLVRRALRIIGVALYAESVCAHQFQLSPLSPEKYESPVEVHSSSDLSYSRKKLSWESTLNKTPFLKSEFIEQSSNHRNRFSHTSALGINIDLPVWGDSIKLQSNIKSGKFESYKSAFFNTRYNPNVQEDLSSQQYQITQGDLSNGLLDLSLLGTTRFFNYGIEYNRVGKTYKSIGQEKGVVRKDREGYDYWIESDFNFVEVKLGYSDTWDNVNFDPSKNRYTEQALKLASKVKLGRWTHSTMAFNYKTGSRYSTYVPIGNSSYDGSISEYGASLFFSYRTIHFNLGSAYEQSRNDLGLKEQAEKMSHYISSRISPFKSIYINPNVTYSVSKNSKEFNTYRFNSLDSSISLRYLPSELPIRTTYYLSYNRSNSSDGLIDSTTLDNTFSLELTFNRQESDTENSLRFDVEHSRYDDLNYNGPDKTDFFAGLRWIYTFQ